MEAEGSVHYRVLNPPVLAFILIDLYLFHFFTLVCI
jgi:hypothetical protein